ncbi:hypothetical protein BDF19DRAFT_410787 [Syncephalis fuscata]|nr:hypothetical protein BDF19DRAFT_410787 [Syncephalis fuscata]
MVLKIGCDEDKSLKDCQCRRFAWHFTTSISSRSSAQEKLRQQWRAEEKKYARKRLLWNEDKAKMETSMRNWLAVMATSTSDLEERTRQHQLDEKDHQKDLFLWDCAREAQKVQQAQWEKEKEKHKHEVLEWEETKRKMEQEFEAYARKEKEHQQKQTQWMEEDKKHKKKKIQWTKEEVQHSLKRLMWANEDRKHQQQRDVWLAEEKAHHSETQAREKEKEALVKLRQQWRKEENYREQTYELADNKTELLKYKHLMETKKKKLPTI